MNSSKVSRRSVVASLAAAALSPKIARIALNGQVDATKRVSQTRDLTAIPTLLSAPLGPGADVFAAGVARGDGTFIAPFQEGPDGLKIFHLRAAPIEWEVEPGKVKQGYAFNGTIPGPTVRVMEGDRIRIVVQNDLPESTVIHWHGMILPFDQDGVHMVTQKDIEPGQSFTYEYPAVATGTHWYHPHMTGDQVGKGLYGSLEVIPRSGERAAHRDYRLFIGDTNLGLVFNGKTFPATHPFEAKVGERVRIRMTAVGEMSHPIHLHGQPFDFVAQDGFPVAVAQTMDTILISTAQTMDIETTVLAPGRWLFHCHIFSHMHKPNGEMTGLVTFLQAPDANGIIPGLSGIPAVPPPVPSDTFPPGGAPSAPGPTQGQGGGH